MKIVKDITTLKTISVEELKSFDGFADVSTEEAIHIINTLKEVSLLTHNIITNYEQSESISKLRKTK
ncbi:hypothetical protein IMCC3317_13210 [Kordia antarctica]|uniref:Uncharacterized protein n=1 Tax=Kordia antarctica TaxID=1218801 RepID=A0A7L4ZGY2_9FLAO|nr:hypothetical protein [Kordia antarctica]QHI35973.1 hypothetical protein IMCC3317_13210 [Kordia antarctica]